MIMVSGISNSGKTHTLAAVCRSWPDLRNISASGILRGKGQPLRLLTIAQAQENQRVLLDCLKGLHAGNRRLMLLDGHVLIETDCGFMSIPDAWYDALAFDAFVHIESKPEDIAERRRAKGLPWNAREAATYQLQAFEEARRKAARQSKPFIAVASGDVDALIPWLRAVVSDADRGCR